MPHTATSLDARVHRGSRVPGKPDVSIITLVMTDTRNLRACLASLDRHLHGRAAVEMVVVANGTPPAELAWLRERDDVIILASSVNLGFGGGCNWAAEVARGRRLVFLNDDAVVSDGWLDGLVAAADSDARVGVAGSRVLLANGTLQEAGGVIWRDGSTSGIGRGMDPSAAAYGVTRDVDYVSFCSAMVTREAWTATGGFDERYFPAYYEDTDLCMRAAALGWRVVCAGASVVSHAEGRSSERRFQRFLKRRNQELFVARWRAELAGFEPAPSLTGGQRAVARALRRAASRARREPPVTGAREGGSATPARAETVAATPDAVSLPAREERALRRLLALEQEFAVSLAAELDTAGLTFLARRRVLAVRAAAGRLLARHPRLSHAVRGVVVSVANRD